VATSQEGTVRYDTHDDGSVDYRNVSLGNGTGDTTIHHVAAGVADTDAVNVNQFKNGMQQAVDWANAYTDQRFSAIDNSIERMGNRANAGVASAMAMAGLPQAYEPGRSMAAVAGSSFHGESSLAIGVSTISEGGRWVYKLTGSTDSRGDAGVTIGAGIQW
jgi:autotransporter adhesin